MQVIFIFINTVSFLPQLPDIRLKVPDQQKHSRPNFSHSAKNNAQITDSESPAVRM